MESIVDRQTEKCSCLTTINDIFLAKIDFDFDKIGRWSNDIQVNGKLHEKREAIQLQLIVPIFIKLLFCSHPILLCLFQRIFLHFFLKFAYLLGARAFRWVLFWQWHIGNFFPSVSELLSKSIYCLWWTEPMDEWDGSRIKMFYFVLFVFSMQRSFRRLQSPFTMCWMKCLSSALEACIQ